MTGGRWRRVDELYHAAQARPAADRVTFLDVACAGDADLRREVESLLAQPAASEDGFLAAPAVEAWSPAFAGPSNMTTMLTGKRIGVYQIQTLLGAGGMGEVYRARDTKLGREVAIKILPKAFTADPDRLARFEREARMLAALNHPNIAAIYGLEGQDGRDGPDPSHAIVMELVEGQTLAEKLVAGSKRPGLQLSTTLSIAQQIADALDAAHEKGIIHRDLKPANIKITSDGTVKVFDFGLAKIGAGGTGGVGRADGEHASAALTIDETREGVVLGTAAYMSPEQARGQAVDKRTDIWAFGCVLYEMLTGRRAFPGVTVSDTIAAVLEREPDWSALPAATPATIARLLKRCLQKDSRRRARDIGDVRVELDETPVAGDPTSSGQAAARVTYGRRQYLAWALAAILLVALGSAIPLLRRSGETPAAPLAVVRTAITLAADQKLAVGDSAYPLAVSPDGVRLAYVAERDGTTQLYVRELSALEPRAIPGTNGAAHPFFSPDGQWVGFFAGGALQKASIAGGAPLRICNVPGVSLGASWGPDNTIVFALRGSGLYKIETTGGTLQPLAGSNSAAWPQILPDGKMVLFTTDVAIATMPLNGGARRIVARTSNSSLEGPAVLGTGGGIAQARFVPSGYLVYGQSPGIVRAVPFDLASLTPTGSPVSLADSVERAANGGAVCFAVSATGLMVYAPTGDRHQLVWVDRNGIATPISADREAFRIPRVSPDGKKIAVAINDETRRSDIWIYDAERGTKNRLTTMHHNLSPVWTPDGTHITAADGGIQELAADGSGTREILLSADQARGHLAAGTYPYPSSWSPDGRDLLFNADVLDLWVLSRGANGVPRPLLVRPSNDRFGQFSPDGRWVAYESDESGRDEVYVARYPDFGSKVAVSADGGLFPEWSRDGRELFYRQGDALMAVAVDTKQGFRAAKPRRLFTGQYTGAARDSSFDVAPDGRRFVMIKSDEASTLRQLTVVQNWMQDLTKLAGPAAPSTQH